jgi:ABC-type Mn2+/Zn2+ transport system ATPase subunit
MRLSKVVLLVYKTIDALAFEAAPLTVLFGKNNVGKSNIMRAIYDVLEPESAREKAGEHGRLADKGAFVCQLDENVDFDDEVSSAVGEVVKLSNNPAVAFLDSSQSHRLLPADPTDLYLTYHALAKEHAATERVEEIWNRSRR